MKTLNLFLFCLTLILLISCTEKTEKKVTPKESTTFNSINNDSIALTKLIRQAYEWYNMQEVLVHDFPYQYDEKQDSIFTGIDWDKYQNNLQLFKQTDFFSTDFLKGHKAIAMTIDASIKKADIRWRNINDGIPLWETDANNWCSCQDYPEEYWKVLTIDSLVINQDKADFVWTWDKNLSHTYRVKAKKEDGKWKINELSGFNFFRDTDVDEYDKMMKD